MQWFSNNLDRDISATLQSLDNEAWTKGWPDFKGEAITQENYVKNFFWLKTWLSLHGLIVFKKILIFLSIIIILNFTLYKIKKNENSNKIKINKKILFISLISLLCVLVWFIRFPAFRYGSSYIIIFLVSISTIFVIKYDLLNKKINLLQKYFKISIIIFLYCLVLSIRLEFIKIIMIIKYILRGLTF